MTRTFNKDTSTSGDYVLPPEGTQAAVLTGLAFCGNHRKEWQGKVTNPEIVVIGYELSEPGPDGRVLSVTETQTASLHEKSNFFQRVVALNGGKEPQPGMPLSDLLGKGVI